MTEPARALMPTDSATHQIVRILRDLHEDTGSMIVQVSVDWSHHTGGFGRKPSTKLARVQLISGYIPIGEAGA